MSDTPTRKPETAATPAPQGPGVVSHGWLAANSTFEHPDERRWGPAALSSLAFHGLLLLAAVFALSYRGEADTLPPPPPLDLQMVYVAPPEPGPGGGGGGSPAPAPPRPIEIPETTPPEPVPVEPEPEVTPPPPIPILDTPIMTNNASVIQASGASAVSLAAFGGGGRGGGIGEGTGDGVGPGTGGGFGGGARQPGNGIEWPRVLHEERPTYTSEGMRAKIQGVVAIEAVVLASGRVGDVRVSKSLDRQFGLDEAGLAAARKWVFSPCTQQGRPVDCRIVIELEFRIH